MVHCFGLPIKNNTWELEEILLLMKWQNMSIESCCWLEQNYEIRYFSKQFAVHFCFGWISGTQTQTHVLGIYIWPTQCNVNSVYRNVNISIDNNARCTCTKWHEPVYLSRETQSKSLANKIRATAFTMSSRTWNSVSITLDMFMFDYRCSSPLSSGFDDLTESNIHRLLMINGGTSLSYLHFAAAK